LLVTLDDGSELSTDAVLAATGRRPNTADLGLDKVGIQTNSQGAIAVNECFETTAAGIYAVGDVIERLQLTPVALAEGEWLALHLFAAETRTISYENVPTAVFSQPQVAAVGLTEEQAKNQYVDIDIYSTTVKPLRLALSGRKESSFIKLVVDGKTDRVLGVHMAGPDASEIMQGFAVALNCGATKSDFDRTIGIHPTLAEELVTLRKRSESTDSR
jgi:glutathione reductase (NADPH)